MSRSVKEAVVSGRFCVVMCVWNPLFPVLRHLGTTALQPTALSTLESIALPHLPSKEIPTNCLPVHASQSSLHNGENFVRFFIYMYLLIPCVYFHVTNLMSAIMKVLIAWLLVYATSGFPRVEVFRARGSAFHLLTTRLT